MTVKSLQPSDKNYKIILQPNGNYVLAVTIQEIEATYIKLYVKKNHILSSKQDLFAHSEGTETP